MGITDTFRGKNLRLREFEEILKELHGKYPERALAVPHDLTEIQDILQQANDCSRNVLAQRLLQSRLEEEFFFSHDSDVEVYQHLRYLPAYWHDHSFIEIACVVRGSCTNYIMDQKIVMEPGDVCIIAPNTTHAISAFADDCLLYNVLLRASTFATSFFGVLSENDILADFFKQTLYNKGGQSYLLFCTGEDPELMEALKTSLREFSRNRQYKNRMMHVLVSSFFITLLRNHGANVRLAKSGSGQESENTVLILKYMEEHYRTLTLTQLASFFNYSERQIERIIKSSTGMTFTQNIQKLKLRQAIRLLQGSSLSIYEIALECGYPMPDNFRAAFKKSYGVSPARYREAMK